VTGRAALPVVMALAAALGMAGGRTVGRLTHDLALAAAVAMLVGLMSLPAVAWLAGEVHAQRLRRGARERAAAGRPFSVRWAETRQGLRTAPSASAAVLMSA
jgi:hypothetical protein